MEYCCQEHYRFRRHQIVEQLSVDQLFVVVVAPQDRLAEVPLVLDLLQDLGQDLRNEFVDETKVFLRRQDGVANLWGINNVIKKESFF